MNVQTWQQVEALFHEALEQPPEARAAFLARACGDDTALCEEVESLLAAHGHEDSLAEFMPALVADWAEASHPHIGKTIGRYQIHSLLGAGGMGEVFLAEDTQLGRRAALKLLPERFAADAMRVRRFEQEARAVLALNHPNIVTLFDLGQADGAFFMATEFVEGETLRARLQREGTLPVREALDFTLQIAAALTAAHAAGIIHRDIKPENVMIRRDGYVKVLDFGLAKVNETRVDDTDSDDSSSLTDTGAVMGTARYMSPEQARGLRVNHRSDQFSLAVVLYEMLAGRAPFAGETHGDLLVAILTAAPAPLVESAPNTPAVLETILLRALEKEAEARYASVAEFAEALKSVAAELAYTSRDSRALPLVAAPVVQAERVRRAGYKLRLLAATAVLALAGTFGWVAFKQMRNHPRTEILPNLKFTLVDSWQESAEETSLVIDIAPDGHTAAYSRAERGQSDIFVKQLPNGKLLNVTNDVWADSSPLWSPDGRELAYLSLRDGRSEVWLIPSLGGQGRFVKALAGTPRFLQRWSRDGRSVYYEIAHNFYSLEVQSGWETPLTDEHPVNSQKDFYALSPDRKRLAYAENVNGVRQLWVKLLAGGAATQITHEGEENQYPLWLPDGERLVYSSRRNGVFQICVAWMDGTSPVQLTATHENMIPWDVSPDGHRIYYVAEAKVAGIYLHHFRTGHDSEFLKEIYPALFPSFAPDGSVLAYQRVESGLNVITANLYAKELGGEVRLTRLATNGFAQLWSPSSSRLAFLRQKENSAGLWTVRADGADERKLVDSRVAVSSFNALPFAWSQPQQFSWSPDETRLAYVQRPLNGAANVWTISTEGGNAQSVTDNQDAAVKMYSPIFSSTGNQLAFLAQREAGGQRQNQIWVVGAGQSRMIYQAQQNVRLLGWLANGKEVLAAVSEEKRAGVSSEVTLWRLSPAGAPAQAVTRLPHAYFYRNALAPDGSQILYVSRPNETNSLDEVWLYSLATGKHRKVTQSSDPTVLIAGLAWSPQQNLFGFIKQSNATSIWMIENFN